MRIGEILLLIGPNRRSERTLIEQQLLPEEQELDALATGGPGLHQRVLAIVPELAIEAHAAGLLPGEPGDAPLARLARLYNGLGLCVQRFGGHRVQASGFEPDSAGEGVWAWFEYEHDGDGEQAADLAVRILRAALAETGANAANPEVRANFAAELESFREHAAEHLLPLDTGALVEAAARRDIPCFKLERDPYPGLPGDFRIRRNGLLMLGHGRHRQLVDGTFCITRCARTQPLVGDREALRRVLETRGVPLPRRAPGGANCALTKRALRAAEGLGYPVVVKPGKRTRGVGVSVAVPSPEALRRAVDSARNASPVVSVEAMVAGDSFHLLVVGGEPRLVLHQGSEFDLERVHPAIMDLACGVSRQLDAGIADFDIVTTDIGQPLDATGGAVVDLDLAPELDALLQPDSPSYRVIADAFLQWLFPPGSPSRVPIVSVTGTNGKTTTCHMVDRILRRSGLHTGLVCSDGIFVDDMFQSSRQDAGVGAHHSLLERDEVEAAVFEEYFGRIARLGFAYRWCDVAVCTNVTNDHLGRIGTHSLEQMADLKRAVPERARRAVVLNGDDDRCRAMADRCRAERVCLVSTRSPLEHAVAELGKRGARCIVERADGQDWVVLYEGDRRIPLVAVADIPATFGGTAEFNVSNALHAAAAAYFAGTGPDAIAAALRSFSMSFEATPGRLNRFGGLPFQVIMDYAHNADGFRHVCAHIDCLPVDGKKIVMVSFTGDRKDEHIRAAIGELAGHFNQYVCRDFRHIRNRERGEIPRILRDGLIAAGVCEQSIHVIPDAIQAVDHALNLAAPGDLVVLLAGGSEFDEISNLLRARAEAGHSPR